MRAKAIKFHNVAMAFVNNSICSFTHIVLGVESFCGLNDSIIENFAIITQNTHEIQIICRFVVLHNLFATMIDDYNNNQDARDYETPQERENENNYDSSSNMSITFLVLGRIASW
ncbi:hypothetical protein BT93_L2465 [Corymbia citriodora subsp. variegata]|uniref:Uncharacterized protein n=1 Tax=Corymbia citriodora subsp. variegata TaxID=360336 RepID=A0A8T0CKY3_CORYI|nr:hypothetical protein BT93_L2465 [Corymbia citriodora subsp. variegata]